MWTIFSFKYYIIDNNLPIEWRTKKLCFIEGTNELKNITILIKKLFPNIVDFDIDLVGTARLIDIHGIKFAYDLSINYNTEEYLCKDSFLLTTEKLEKYKKENQITSEIQMFPINLQRNLNKTVEKNNKKSLFCCNLFKK